MEKFSPDLGRNIRIVRESRGLSQIELSQRTKITQGTISNIETGKADNPQLQTVLKICEALNFDLTSLIYGPLPRKPRIHMDHDEPIENPGAHAHSKDFKNLQGEKKE